jgi:excisionase family DNA binding protein
MYSKPLTIDEAAARVGIHRTNIYLAIKRGALKASKFGTTYMIWPGDLAEYIHNHPRPSLVAHINVEELRR